MKKHKSYSYIFCIAIISMLLLLVVAQQLSTTCVSAYSNENKICVNGVGEVRVKPDTAVITVGVETLNSSVATAQKNNASSMDKIIETLASNNIKKENIKTKNYFVREKYDYSGGQEFMGYQVSNYIEFKTTDLGNLSSLLTTLTENGANAFNGIYFELSNADEAYNQALKKAIENAQSKLETLNVQKQNYAITCISEEYSYNSACNYSQFDMLKAESAEQNIAEGEVCIKAQVKVVFEKQTPNAENQNTNNVTTNQQVASTTPHPENNTIHKIGSETNENEIIKKTNNAENNNI